MERTYYLLYFRLDKKTRTPIWFTSAHEHGDGVISLPDKNIPIFSSKSDCHAFAKTQNIELEIEIKSGVAPNLLEMDIIVHWLKLKKMKRARQVHCEHFLNAWNLLADVSNSISGDFDAHQKQTQRIYQKLFWGSNLPSLTPPEKVYVPFWSGQELQMIQEVLRRGLWMFRNHIKRI